MVSGRSGRVPPPVAPHPKQDAHHFTSSGGVNQPRVSMKQCKLCTNKDVLKCTLIKISSSYMMENLYCFT